MLEYNLYIEKYSKNFKFDPNGSIIPYFNTSDLIKLYHSKDLDDISLFEMLLVEYGFNYNDFEK